MSALYMEFNLNNFFYQYQMIPEIVNHESSEKPNKSLKDDYTENTLKFYTEVKTSSIEAMVFKLKLQCHII